MAVKKENVGKSAACDLGIVQLIFGIGVVVGKGGPSFIICAPEVGNAVGGPGFACVTAPGGAVETACFDSSAGLASAAVSGKCLVDTHDEDFAGSDRVGTARHTGTCNFPGGAEHGVAGIGVGLVIEAGRSERNWRVQTNILVQRNSPVASFGPLGGVVVGVDTIIVVCHIKGVGSAHLAEVAQALCRLSFGP